MMPWHWIALLIVTSLFGEGGLGTLGGTVSPSLEKPETRIKTTCQQRILCNLLSRATEPEWVEIEFQEQTALLPYSAEWRIGSSGLSLFDATNPTEIRFGRPVDYLTTVLREYTIRREDGVAEWPPRDNASCVGQSEEVQEVTVDGVEGLFYFSGGAKWCHMVFAFLRGSHAYYVERNLEPFVELHGIAPLDDGTWPAIHMDAEMQRIIKNVVPELGEPSPRHLP